MSEFPHGVCECASGSVSRTGCCGGRGPAAFEVIREGKPVRLCTRCDVSADKPTRRLLVTGADPIDRYRSHDELGFFCIAMRLALEETEA